MKKKSVDSGLTILELMIAISIFGFLMLYISNIMGQQIRLHNLFIKRDDVSQKARNAMMHVLDEIRFTPLTQYKDGTDGTAPGIYYYDINQPYGVPQFCLIDANVTDPANIRVDADGIPNVIDDTKLPSKTAIYYVQSGGDGALWYRDIPKDGSFNPQTSYSGFLLANHVKIFQIKPVSGERLVQIFITLNDPSVGEDYSLLSYIFISQVY